jgi:hypothetical protein
MTKTALIETVQPEFANVHLIESADEKKAVVLSGIAIQGDIKNRNGRVYPKAEIENAVKQMKERLQKDGPIPGECDHPDNLGLDLARVSHLIKDVWMEGADGHAKFEIMPFGLGEIITGLIRHGMKMGVSSRGSGNVDSQGNVSDFEILTIDVVANPSAPDAYPRPIVESLHSSRSGREVMSLAEAVRQDPQAQKYLKEGLIEFMKNELKL